MAQQVIDNKRYEILLITELDIKTKTGMSANKVDTSLVNYIVLAQDLYIKKILGATIYSQLMAEWVQQSYNPDSLPDGTYIDPITTPTATSPIIVGDTINYKELYEQLRKPLIWWSYVLCLPNTAIKVEEAGIMLNGTDYSESSGIVGLDRLVAEAKMIAGTYTDDFKEYVCKIFEDNTDVNSESEDVGGASIGIFVPKRNHHRNRNCTSC